MRNKQFKVNGKLTVEDTGKDTNKNKRTGEKKRSGIRDRYQEAF